MSNIYDSDVISRLRDSLNVKKTKSEQYDIKLREASREAFKQAENIFFDKLDIFVKETLPNSLEYDNHEFVKNELSIDGKEFSIDFTQYFKYDNFLNFIKSIRKDEKFKNICKQLFSDVQIKLDFNCKKNTDKLYIKFIAHYTKND
jgi:hypothetical protein